MDIDSEAISRSFDSLRRSRSEHLVRLLAVSIAMIAGACGAGSSQTTAPSTTASSTTTSTASSTTTSTGVSGDTVISMAFGGRFDPKEVTIHRGSTVTWQDVGTPERHNVVFRDSATATDPDPSLPSHVDEISIRGTYSVMFDSPGTHRYVCTFHEAEGMRGRVTVVD